MKTDSSSEKNLLSTELDSERLPLSKTIEDLESIDPWVLSDFDEGLVGWSDSQFFGQTDYQNKYFVVNSQVTPWRQMRQAIMEIQTRLNALQKVTISYKRTLNDIARIRHEMETEEDPYYKQDKEYEIEILLLDKQVWHNKLRQCKREIEGLLRIIKERTGENVDLEDLETLKATILAKENEEGEEIKYWIARLAKQCSIDLLTTGRIQAGNLDSMLMMSPEDQAAVTDLAMTYSTAMNINVGKIKAAAEDKVENMLKGQGPQMFDTAGVLTDYANNNVEDRYLQSSDKSETGS